jgi:xylulokinase
LKKMLLLGIDIGTSSIKVSVVEAASGQAVASAQFPEKEASIISLQSGWAEQSPESWWEYLQEAWKKALAAKSFDPKSIAAIGISYQMHGLVLVDQQQKVLRNSIIWCDSRAVAIGNEAEQSIGPAVCNSCLLNSPGNFTASKLAWVKKNEPELYKKVYKMMLPGDFIAMKLTGAITTTPSALSEGILWNFASGQLAREVMEHYGFDAAMIPELQPLFSVHGKLTREVAAQLKIKEGTPVSYKAGDQPNNALSLNVLQPGEVAATAGTSGVIYAVTDKLLADRYSRVNSFVHVNHSADQKRVGVLLCINSVGIMNRWARELCGQSDYRQLNQMAASVAPGSEGLMILPFGNGAERMLQNRIPGAAIVNIDLNKHGRPQFFRAVQEGIAFAFRYGLDIMRENGLHPSVIRAGRANMFLSDVFTEVFVNATGVPVELYENDGSVGAALGAGIGAGIFRDYSAAFKNFKPLKKVEVKNADQYEDLYRQWKKELQSRIEN